VGVYNLLEPNRAYVSRFSVFQSHALAGMEGMEGSTPCNGAEERSSTAGFVQCDGKKSVAWKAHRRLSRTQSALYADAQSEHQTRRILSGSIWHVLDTERTGIVSDDSIRLVSNLTTIATRPHAHRRAQTPGRPPTNGAEPRKSTFAEVLEKSKGPTGKVTLDQYLHTLQEQPVSLGVECGPAACLCQAH
jgi:hypothetical protein